MMETPDGAIFEEFIVTCRTKGCDAEDFPVKLFVEVTGMLVYCGPCGQKIEDIEPIPDEV